MKNIARLFLVAAATTVSLSAQSVGPSTLETPYLTPTAPGWTSKSLLTVGDSIGGYLMVGIPDGLGAYSSGVNEMTVFANHELGATVGTTRAHGAIGSFVSKWVINTSTWTVTSGADLVASPADMLMWNGTGWAAGSFVSGTFSSSTPYAVARLCSGDLAPLSAFWDGTNGYNGRLFMNGEETGPEGKAFAWVATGSEAGKAYELPHLGKYSWENAHARFSYGTGASAANLAQTVVIGTDDATPGQVYVYIGTKNALAGNAIQKAGLANGTKYGIKVTSATGYTGAVTTENATGINGTFQLAQVFDNATIANKTGAQFQTESVRVGVTEFARPEDVNWMDHDSAVFATTGASVSGITVSSKIYQLDFNSSAAAGILTTGGNIKVLVNSANLTGTDGLAARSFDNLTVGNDGLIYIQEDPGSQSYIAKHWVVNPNAGTQAQIEASAVQIFESDRGRFLTGASDFRTIDEEHSGIIDITSIVNDGIAGSKWFLVATQNHAAATGANAATLVEGGQFLALNYTVGSDSSVDVGTGVMTLNNGARVVANGAAVTNGIALTGTGGVITTTAATTISGQITGSGQLWKNGSGTLTLTGNNIYTGNSNISEGKLVLNGNVTSSVLVYKNASFGGSGRITGNFTNLGTLAPGNSPGTLTISGNYTEGGTLDIEVEGTNAGTQHDQVVVSGTATFQAGSNLKVTKTGVVPFDLTRTQSVLAVNALAYSGAFTTLDRGTQTSQVFFNNATGRIHGSGLTETQTFADLTTDTNRKAIATALYADGLTSAQVIKNGTAVLATSKAFIATGEMGAATVAFLGAANVDTALDAFSPEVYGTSLLMASRNTYSLARSLAGAQAFGDTWNAQLGYDQQQSTSTASTTTLNGAFDVNSTYALLSRKVGTASVFSVLFANNNGKSTASGFASESSGESYGLGFGTEFDLGRLDFGLVAGELTSSGSRSGQTFSNQKINATTLSARMSFTKLGAITPYVALSRNIAQSDAFSEVGTGANLNVAAAKQSDVTAEVGMGYGIKLDENVTVSLNVAYEHALATDGDTLNASFADAAAPTSFAVRTFGAGQDLLRGGVGFNLGLGEGRTAALSYDYHTGADVKSAHQIKASYSFRF
jgi:autotransporter-associated beta strand protein